MLASFKKLVKWSPNKSADNMKTQTSLLLSAFIGLVEDILFWENVWLSMSFILFVNILFFVCFHEQVNILQFVFAFCITLNSIDALEMWLKYKHRTSFLKTLASYEPSRLNAAATKLKYWLRRCLVDFVSLRDANHTKAFLVMNIALGIIFIIGKYMNGYVLAYLISMLVCTYRKVAPPLLRIARSIQINAESDAELENLIPVATEADIKLLSMEPEKIVIDGNESLVEESSDDSCSSDNSSSITTNLTIDKLRSLERDIETSDSSEDEYIPLIEKPKEQLQTTLEVASDGMWSNSAYNALSTVANAMANVMNSRSSSAQQGRKTTSPDSSDSFEIIDNSDLL